MTTCSIEGCNRPQRSRGWCMLHYQRWWKWGDPELIMREQRASSASHMRAMPTECVKHQFSGTSLSGYLTWHGCDQRDINRITARRFRYGSFRPSDRAAMLLDSSPELTPIAAD